MTCDILKKNDDSAKIVIRIKNLALTLVSVCAKRRFASAAAAASCLVSSSEAFYRVLANDRRIGKACGGGACGTQPQQCFGKRGSGSCLWCGIALLG